MLFSFTASSQWLLLQLFVRQILRCLGGGGVLCLVLDLFGFIWIDFKFGGSCSLSGLLLVLLRFCQIGWPWLGLSRFEFFYLFFYFIEAFGVG